MSAVWWHAHLYWFLFLLLSSSCCRGESLYTVLAFAFNKVVLICLKYTDQNWYLNLMGLCSKFSKKCRLFQVKTRIAEKLGLMITVYLPSQFILHFFKICHFQNFCPWKGLLYREFNMLTSGSFPSSIYTAYPNWALCSRG